LRITEESSTIKARISLIPGILHYLSIGSGSSFMRRRFNTHVAATE